MARFRHVPILRRRREGKTDYRHRKAILLGRTPFATVRVSNRNVLVQVLRPHPTGDRIVAACHSRQLGRLGWKGGGTSLPAAYLVGLVAGTRARREGVEKAVLYMGVNPFIRGSRAAAAAQGLREAGMVVPMDEEVLPPAERLRGDHIRAYAQMLSKTDPDSYKRRFAALLRRKLRPEAYPEHFEEVRKAVLEKLKAKARE